MDYEDYHKPTDTADKIEYKLLKKRTKLIFHTIWEIANRDQTISLELKKGGRPIRTGDF